MRVFYMAHPVSGDVEANLVNARLWLAKLTAHYGERALVIAPWIQDVDGTTGLREPDDRAWGLRRDLTLIRRCDAVVLVGGRLSGGMRTEADAAIAAGLPVYSFLFLGPSPRHLRDGVHHLQWIPTGPTKWSEA